MPAPAVIKAEDMFCFIYKLHYVHKTGTDFLNIFLHAATFVNLHVESNFCAPPIHAQSKRFDLKFGLTLHIRHGCENSLPLENSFVDFLFASMFIIIIVIIFNHSIQFIE